MRVALFTSCAADLAAPRPALAAVRVLEAMGMTVDVPGAQTCCGQVALNSGHREPASELMRRWGRTFGEYDAVVGVSGSCTATVHHQFPRVLEDRAARLAVDAARRTWEFTRFVAHHDAALDLALSGDVTWHDSCHMLRSLGEKAAPRDVLGRVRGLRVHEAPGSEVCCGFGGTFALKYPELSCAMADRKITDVTRTDATHLVSSDSTCLLHLSGRAARRRVPLRALHVAELLAAALPGGPGTLEEAFA
ncbi:(Fe-S)-binding protein [Streptomyces meridianus]|uniref:(Fe-S)-binding protein n=1 Tax=Streptomyces meridianus TaxID=2938945 RepID=A0ABT0XDL1_9ACTN|nr:(Fe-S)-binding protein [Streptomyces meridianus]MCM2580615.1 (Fe-S)-binding protein [Streptomyces meridianus]